MSIFCLFVFVCLFVYIFRGIGAIKFLFCFDRGFAPIELVFMPVLFTVPVRNRPDIQPPPAVDWAGFSSNQSVNPVQEYLYPATCPVAFSVGCI